MGPRRARPRWRCGCLDGVLTVRVAPPLFVLLTSRHRRAAQAGTLRVDHDGTSTLGHVVESLGVPLTEVGQLRVDGRPVPPAHRPRSGAVVDVAPVTRPQPLAGPQRFLLDVHLGALARRLRLLGIDAAYRNDTGDDALVEWADAEQRVLLSQDRGLLRRRAVRRGAFVYGARPDVQLRDVVQRFAPDIAPWTRCTACNGELAAVAKAAVADLLPPGTRRTYDEFARCRECGRLYWRGAHARRLEALVAAAEDAAAPPGPR